MVEFSTPVSNRDRKLISSYVFEDYYQRVLSTLEMQGVEVDSRQIVNPDQLRARQSLLLFGGKE